MWWASHHRAHHRHADTERDVHSPLKGFCDKATSVGSWPTATKVPTSTGFVTSPGSRSCGSWTETTGSAHGCSSRVAPARRVERTVVGFFPSTVVLWHATFLVNSLAHVVGRRRYETADSSGNLLIAVVTFGEGWHNNHHRLPDIRPTGVLLAGARSHLVCAARPRRYGVVHGLRRPPRSLLEGRPTPPLPRAQRSKRTHGPCGRVVRAQRLIGSAYKQGGQTLQADFSAIVQGGVRTTAERPGGCRLPARTNADSDTFRTRFSILSMTDRKQTPLRPLRPTTAAGLGHRRSPVTARNGTQACQLAANAERIINR